MIKKTSKIHSEKIIIKITFTVPVNYNKIRELEDDLWTFSRLFINYITSFSYKKIFKLIL